MWWICTIGTFGIGRGQQVDTCYLPHETEETCRLREHILRFTSQTKPFGRRPPESAAEEDESPPLSPASPLPLGRYRGEPLSAEVSLSLSLSLSLSSARAARCSSSNRFWSAMRSTSFVKSLPHLRI